MGTFELYKDRRGQFRWRLKASNGKIIADSGEGYVQKADCQHGIDLVKSEAAGAELKEMVDEKANSRAKPKVKATSRSATTVKTKAPAKPKTTAKAKTTSKATAKP